MGKFSKSDDRRRRARMKMLLKGGKANQNVYTGRRAKYRAVVNSPAERERLRTNVQDHQRSLITVMAHFLCNPCCGRAEFNVRFLR